MPSDTPRSNSSRSSKRWLIASVALFVALAIGQVSLVGLTLHSLAGVRAFIGAEGTWSKNEKELVIHLVRFAWEGNSVEYDHAQEHYRILREARLARLEMGKAEPDMQAIRRGLEGLGVSPEDIPAAVDVFRRFDWAEQIQKAQATWAEGDELIAELGLLAEQLHKDLSAGPVALDDLNARVTRIRALNDELAELEAHFSQVLAEGARWAGGIFYLVLILFTFISLALQMTLVYFTWRLIRRSQSYSAELEQQTWRQGVLAGLNDRLRGDPSEADLCREAVTYLARELDVQVGAFYVAEPDGTLALRGSYAHQDRKHADTRFAPGEGLVGQAALEKTPIQVRNLPDDYVRIRSGLGEAVPKAALVFPLLLKDRVLGVLELARLQPFDQRLIDVLEQLSTPLAVGLQSVRARAQTEELLAQTQQQAEELQVQQEELRQVNEELEEQAEELRISQERLQGQQSRLEETNAELEERSEALERERNRVNKQNDDLQAARREVEAKAQQLAVTSRYKSEFLANMSHELRTPLNSVLLLSRLLAEDEGGRLSEKQIQFARTINESGTELLSLIDEVLDLSKVEAGKLELTLDAVALEAFCRGFERQFGPQAAERGLAFQVELADGLPERIRTDEQRLSQILRNLLSNALKFTSQGEVCLRVGRPAPEDLKAVFDGPAPDDVLAFSVQDTGIGIPEDKQRLIFEAFQQADGSTSRRFGGTGLGLAISRELAGLLGGGIVLHSQPGQGSRFSVILPVEPVAATGSVGPGTGTASGRAASADTGDGEGADNGDGGDDVDATPVDEGPEPPPEPDDDRAELKPGDRCVLIVEDDRAFARQLLDLARDRGFPGILAADGETGLALADFYTPSAILLDLGLPGLDGMAVIDRLKDSLRTRHIPVHVISGHEGKLASLKKGAAGFLQKPVNMEQLEGAFRRIDDLVSRPVKSLLVVHDDGDTWAGILELLGADDVEIVHAAGAEQAVEMLDQDRFDCAVIDSQLPGGSGAELLERIRRMASGSDLPVVVYAREDLPTEDQLLFDRYADRVVVAGQTSQVRLLDETALFLHRVDRELPEKQQRIIRRLHSDEAIFADKRVLLVDDDMRNVFALTSILEQRGIEVLVAKDGQEALDRLDETPGVNLVVMDIMMPVMDGYEAMRRIRAQPRFAELPVIALTAKAMKGDRAKCIQAGASDYLAKPVDSDRLLSMLRVWLYA